MSTEFLQQPPRTRSVTLFAVLGLILLVLAAGMWWYYTQVLTIDEVDEVEILEETGLLTPQRFSEHASRSGRSIEYLNARYITDISQLTSTYIQFANDEDLGWLFDPQSVTAAMADLVEIHSEEQYAVVRSVIDDPFAVQVDTNQTLSDIVHGEGTPATAALIEAALTDLRAGVVSLQDRFDVAPPRIYDDSIAPAESLQTPSFPSLSAAEVSLIHMLIAELQPDHTQHYEKSALVYLDALAESGLYFERDIQYATRVAAAYFETIQGTDEYEALLDAARAEMDQVVLVDFTNARSLTLYDHRFRLPAFPFASQAGLTESSNDGYVPQNSAETLSGGVYMTLTNELDQHGDPQLYRYDVGTDTIQETLPQAHDRSPFTAHHSSSGEVVFAGEVHGGGHYDTGIYGFIDGDIRLLVEPSAHKAGHRYAESRGPQLNSDGTMVVYQALAYDDVGIYSQLLREVDRWGIYAGLTDRQNAEPLLLTNGAHPQWARDDQYIVYVAASGIYAYDIAKTTDQLLVTPSSEEQNFGYNTQISLSEDKNHMVINRFVYEGDTPVSLLEVYRLVYGNESLSAERVYQMRFVDSSLFWPVLSPEGRYLAVQQYETLSRRLPRVLLIDLVDSEILREVSLEGYDVNAAFIDGWLDR